MPSRPDTTVKYFESTQANAPVLSGSAAAMIAVLDAVLVNGFGLKSVDSISISGGYATLSISTGHSAILDSVVEIAGVTNPAALNGQHRVTQITTNTIKIYVPDLADGAAAGTMTVKQAAAGWSKVYSKTNVAVYKSGNAGATGMLVRVDDSGAQTFRYRGYEAMTDVDTGTGLFPTDAQVSGGLYIDKSSAASTAARGWTVIANDRSVYFGIDNTNATLTNRSMQWNFFGDIVSRKANDAYRFLMTGRTGADPGAKRRASNAAAWFGYYSTAYRLMPRSFAGLGGSIIACFSTINRALDADALCGDSFTTPFPNPVDNSILLGEIIVHESATRNVRGKLPGQYCPLQNTGNLIPDATIFDNCADLPGRRLLSKIVDGSNDGGSAGNTFFDLTGPWDY